MKKLLIAFGTRPEVIKLAPVIKELESTSITPVLLHTGQHRELASQMLKLFDISPDYDLEAMSANNDAIDLHSKLLPEINSVIRAEKPDGILVQGDTTSAFVSALAGFYLQIPVFHLEAGLRSHDLNNPFPEELYRRQIATMASVHFAPTGLAKQNLITEGISGDEVYICGNTVIDALEGIRTSSAYRQSPVPFTDSKEITLVTVHRKENQGAALHEIVNGIISLVNEREGLEIVWPLHPNPHIQQEILRLSSDHPAIHHIEPAGYIEFLRLMERAELILTDSGGVQEEASALGKKLLVLRSKTERQELIDCGYTALIGSDQEKILSESMIMLESAYKQPVAIYGDGQAAKKVVDVLKAQL